jgi:hypothetical protein
VLKIILIKFETNQRLIDLISFLILRSFFMKRFVFIGYALLFANGLIANINTSETNDVQIVATQQQTIFEGVGAITHRPIILRLMRIIGRGEGPNALNPLSDRPVITRVASFDENPIVIAHHNQITVAAQQNAH